MHVLKMQFSVTLILDNIFPSRLHPCDTDQTVVQDCVQKFV